MMKYLYLILVFAPFISAQDFLLDLTQSMCFGESDYLHQCIKNDHRIIFHKAGWPFEYTLDKEGAQEAFNNPQFNKTGVTTIFEHGFTSSPDAVGSQKMIEAYSYLESTTNFFIINSTSDFGGYYVDPLRNYIRSSQATRCVGRLIADFLVGLRELGVGEDLIHLIGHSLGAQTMHSAGQRYLELTGVKVNRITGMDPAGPCFDPSTTEQLNSDDATLVDIIHTNAGILGTITRLGQANFIPNGGTKQNGCGADITCSHSRPAHYYLESVLSDQCMFARVDSHSESAIKRLLNRNDEDDIEQLGYRWSGKPGLFEAKTRRSALFCEGRDGLKLHGLFHG